MLNGAKVVACAEKLGMGTNTEQLREMFSDPNHPKEVCARLCIYQAMELVDDNFEIFVSIFGQKALKKILHQFQKFSPETEVCFTP